MHGILVTLVPLLLLTLIATSTFLNQPFIAVLATSSLIGYVVITLCQLLLLEYLVRRIVKKRNECTNWLNPLKLIAFFPAMILTQLLYPKALLFALFSRNIEWRGINYRIDAPLKVKMLNYEPYKIKARKNKNSSL